MSSGEGEHGNLVVDNARMAKGDKSRCVRRRQDGGVVDMGRGIPEWGDSCDGWWNIGECTVSLLPSLLHSCCWSFGKEALFKANKYTTKSMEEEIRDWY